MPGGAGPALSLPLGGTGGWAVTQGAGVLQSSGWSGCTTRSAWPWTAWTGSTCTTSSRERWRIISVSPLRAGPGVSGRLLARPSRLLGPHCEALPPGRSFKKQLVFSWGFWFHNTCGRNRWREEVNRLAPSIYLQGELSCYFQVTLATHSSTLAWQIPWREEPGRLQSMGSLRVGYDWASSLSFSCIGEGNGNPLQCSCLEDPRDGGAWWAAVSGVAQSWTRLKRLSSSSSSKGYLLCIEWNFRSFGQDAWFSPILINFKIFEIIMDL